MFADHLLHDDSAVMNFDPHKQIVRSILPMDK